MKMKVSDKVKLVLDFNIYQHKQRAKEKNPLRIPVLHPLIIGVSGVGKSALAYEIALQYTDEPAVVHLGMIPQEEVGGIPKLEGDLLEYKLPYWTERKVVILDEIDFVAERNPENIMLMSPALMDYKLHGKKIKTELFIACSRLSIFKTLKEEKESFVATFVNLFIFIPFLKKEAPVFPSEEIEDRETPIIDYKLPEDYVSQRITLYINSFFRFLREERNLELPEAMHTIKSIFYYLPAHSLMKFVNGN